MSSVDVSEPTYSFINLLNTNDDDDALNELHDDDDAITDYYDDDDNNDDDDEDDDDDNDDKLICERNLNANNYRLRKAKAAHNSVLGKTDASLARKTLTAAEAPHLDTKSFFAKLVDVAKTVDLDVSTILAEQIKVPVFGTVRSSLRKGILPEAKSPEVQQSKGLLRYCQEFDQLLIEEEGQLLCYEEL